MAMTSPIVVSAPSPCAFGTTVGARSTATSRSSLLIASLLPPTGLRTASSPLILSGKRSPSFTAKMKAGHASAMAVSLPVLTFEGEASGSEVELDLKCAHPETARAVVHRGLITEQQNKRRGTASTLTRGEVRGGGRKPYKQKKTGRARRGSQRTPLRRGGGVIFGPKPRDWTIKINRKEKRLAISTALQHATSSFVVVEDFEDSIEPKTKSFIAAMQRWGVDHTRSSLLFSMNATDNLVKSSRNLGTLKLMTPRNVNLFDLLKAQKLIFTRSAIEYLNACYGLETGVEDEGEGDEEVEEDPEEEEEKEDAVEDASA